MDVPDNAGASYAAAALLSLGREYRELYATTEQVIADYDVQNDRVAQLQRTLDDASAIFLLIDQAAHRPFVGFPAGTEFQLRSAGAASMIQTARARTIALASLGNPSGAVQSALSALAVERISHVLAWLPPGDMSIAAILRLSRPEPRDLLLLQEALAGDDSDDITAFLTSRRIQFVNAMLSRYFGTTLADFGRPGRNRSMADLIRRPATIHQLVNDLKEWQSYIDLTKLPFEQRHGEFVAVLSRSESLSKPSVGSAMFALAARSDALSIRRTSRVAVAIERYRRDNSDTLPKALQSLVPVYLDALPRDPFSDASMRYVQSPTSYTIYSVGADLVDDRGSVKPESARRKSRDIGITISIRR